MNAPHTEPRRFHVRNTYCLSNYGWCRLSTNGAALNDSSKQSELEQAYSSERDNESSQSK